MTILEHAKLNGARTTARALINQRLRQYGFNIEDLPDSCDLCAVVDDLEGMINDGIDRGEMDVKTIAATIMDAVNEDTLGDYILG